MKIFGILNITPDSFSDGGNFIAPETAAKQAEQLIKDGADALDIGAESTRPGAVTVSPEDEWKRLQPVLDALNPFPFKISIDTRNSYTAAKALAYKSVKYINDVSGFKSPDMIEAVKNADVDIITMHSLTVPADKNIILTTPPVETIKNWILEHHAMLLSKGISAERIIFDPGLGFGKNAAQSQEIIDNAKEITETCHNLGSRILFGHSRKSFIGGDVNERDLKTAEITAYLQKANVDCIRVHNVEINRRFLST